MVITQKILVPWIFGLLFICLTGARADGPNYFPENFVVAKRNNKDPVVLTCSTSADRAVTWKFDGDVVTDFVGKVQLYGQDLNVSDVEEPMLGNYSCWSGGELLSSLFLLLEAEGGGELDSTFNCWAKSYDCNFSCKWTSSENSMVRVGLGDECAKGGKSCQWVKNSGQFADGEFQFLLPHSLSPFAEENTTLEVTAEAMTDHLIFIKKTKSFYLRDIIRPDSPRIVKCQVVDENLNVTIDPPSSWSTPHSFFSLEHETEYVLRDDGQTGRSSTALVPKGISKMRVRSRDSLVQSAWSQWSPWKNVRRWKKKSCTCKNTGKSCCPSGHLDHCKPRKKKQSKVADWRQTSVL